jgi:translocator protein
MDWISLLPFLGIALAVATSGAVFTPGEWYEGLNKPSWTPPDWLFAPAWSLLYLMIAVAGWLVWWREGFGVAIAVWAANLVLNSAWSWLMFGKHRIDLALADAAAMLATIVIFIGVSWPVSPIASLLFLPYLAWVAFATALNWSILKHNPQWVPVVTSSSEHNRP